MIYFLVALKFIRNKYYGNITLIRRSGYEQNAQINLNYIQDQLKLYSIISVAGTLWDEGVAMAALSWIIRVTFLLFVPTCDLLSMHGAGADATVVIPTGWRISFERHFTDERERELARICENDNTDIIIAD